MGISDLIASFLQDSLDTAEDGVLEVQRSDLAQRFNCVPSQINYVMSTRFSPERGYIVESRRGGNGYIRITRVQVDRQTLMMHVINSLGDSVDRGFHQGHSQQPGAVRGAGTQRGSDDPHRRGRQGPGPGAPRETGCRPGGYFKAGAHSASVVPAGDGASLKAPQYSQSKNLYTVYGRNQL